MATRNLAYIVHPALGGLDTTKAATLLEPDQLTIADNVEYFTSGARKKRLGTARYNASAISGTPTVTAVADFWRHGTGIGPTQKFVACAGTSIWKDDNDGVWDEIQTLWGTATSRTHITIAQGYAVFSNSNNDIPQRWDQTTLAALTAGTIRFEACVYHLRRLFPIGEQTAHSGTTNPSRSRYCAASDITDFTGGDTGELIFDDDDGDRLVGVSQPFHGRLYFFKGPTRGSVHELTGTTAATFARNKVFTGAPCVTHAGIITTPNDVFWASRYGFHSLRATQKYGDTEETFISRPIQSLFNALSLNRLSQIVGFYHPTRNIVGWNCADAGQVQNNLCFIYNYLLDRWAVWDFTGLNQASCAVMLDPAGTGLGQPRLYFGGYDGFVYEGDQTTQTDANGSAYTARIRTPVHARFSDELTELHEKSFYSVTTMFKPKGNYSASLDVNIDGRTSSTTIALAGGGIGLGTFTLGSSTLGVLGGGSPFQYAESIINDRGRSIQVQWSQSGANQDMEIYGHAIRFAPAEGHAMESS